MRKLRRKATRTSNERGVTEPEANYGCSRSSGHVLITLVVVPSDELFKAFCIRVLGTPSTDYSAYGH